MYPVARARSYALCTEEGRGRDEEDGRRREVGQRDERRTKEKK
jgi:hypothetical protein